MFKAIANIFRKRYKKHYLGIYRKAKKLFIFDLILLFSSILILVVGLFFFFWKPTIVNLIDINFSTNVIGRLATGQELTIDITYFNRSKHYLEEVVLAVHLPKGFILDKNINNTLEENFTMDLEKISPGAKETISISGVIFSEIGKDEKITAYLSYRPEDKKNKEQKISAFILRATESVLSIETKIPETSIPQATIPLTLTLKNTGNFDLENISLNTENSYPLQDTQNELGNFSLVSGETKVFASALKIPLEEGEHEVNFNFDIFVNNHSIPFQNLKKKVQVIKPNISVGMRSEFKNNYADVNDVIPLKIYWNNPSDFELKNVKIKLITSPEIVNFNASALNNRLKIEDGQLVIDGTARTSLASASPHASDEFIINLQLQPFFKTENQNQLEVKIIAEAEMPELPEQKLIYEGKDIVRLPLATHLVWQIRPVYFTDSGDQLGRGPLPPEVEQATKYWIFIELESGVNGLINNQFKATLDESIQFTGKQSVTIGQEIIYNKENNSLNWNYNHIPALSKFGLYFEVESTPNISQIGQKINLIKNLSFSAEDEVTGKKFNLSNAIIDNQLNKNDKGSLFSPIITK